MIRQCKKCNHYYPATEEYFYKSASGKSKGYCKNCCRTMNKQKRQWARNKERVEFEWEGRRCRALLVKGFGKDKQTLKVIRNWSYSCKKCGGVIWRPEWTCNNCKKIHCAPSSDRRYCLDCYTILNAQIRPGALPFHEIAPADL